MGGNTIKIGKHIKFWQEANLPEVNGQATFNFFAKERIAVKDRWFDVIPIEELVRNRNKKDGYYRVLYIQINFENNEYYIGKVNRPKWSEIIRYQGSGLLFKAKFNKYKDNFVRYYIEQCDTAEETEQLEAELVDEELLSDKKCLNLIAGGAGTTKRISAEERNEKIRQHMLNHPEQYQAMIKASKKVFSSGDTPELRRRSRRIKDVMTTGNKYRDMFRDRLNKWKTADPEAYNESREKNKESIRRPEVQKKRAESLDKWKEENPGEFSKWQEKRINALKEPESRQKRKDSLKRWREANPQQHKANATKRAKAAGEKLSKKVWMLDLTTEDVLKEFNSQRDAARWLVDQGIAKNINCVTSISAVCLGKPLKSGKHRNTAYGFGWRFA